MARLRQLLRNFFTSPILLILLIAPYFGEGLSGSTPPLDLLLPWNLAYMVALYGCGALVCREVAHRFGLGFSGLVLVGVAYGVWEEALVDRYWFFPLSGTSPASVPTASSGTRTFSSQLI